MGTQNRLAELNGDLAQEMLYPEGEIRGDMNCDEIVGKSAALRWLLNQVETVAPTESTVLIYGETGTGKVRCGALKAFRHERHPIGDEYELAAKAEVCNRGSDGPNCHRLARLFEENPIVESAGAA